MNSLDAINNVGMYKLSLKPTLQKKVIHNSENFGDLLTKFIADVNKDLQQAHIAQKKLIDGKVDNMVELMATIEKADISLRFLTEVRNKALEAYQEIMRMQV